MARRMIFSSSAEKIPFSSLTTGGFAMATTFLLTISSATAFMKNERLYETIGNSTFEFVI